MLAPYWRLLRDNQNFRKLWLAQVVSELGDWFYALAIYNLLLELTGSATLVGLALVLQVLPQTLVAPTAGVVNDRLRRKRVMIAADLARAAIVLGMLVVRARSMVWFVFPLLFLESTMAAFFEPARNSVVPNITEPRDLLRANTLASATWCMNLAVGALFGGVAGALLGRDAVFILNAGSFLASAFWIRSMRFAEPHAAGTPPFRARELVDFSPILEGLRYIRSDRRVLTTVFVKCGIGFTGANNVILPLMGSRIFPVHWEGLAPDRGAMLGMSLLVSARGIGALFGPMLGGAWAGEHGDRLRTGILIGYLVAAAGYMSLSWAPTIGVAVACVVLANFGMSSNWVFSTTLLQLSTEDRFRGRVFSAEIGLLTLTIAISGYLAGVCNDWGVPVRTLAFANGAIALIPAAAWAIAMRGRAAQPPIIAGESESSGT
jgi:MFS family permease